jgi:hypothetical protein
MLANHLGYEFIGSDIKIDYAKQNATWRKTTKFYTPDKQFDIFSHDVNKKIDIPLLTKEVSLGVKSETKKDILIVSE